MLDMSLKMRLLCFYAFSAKCYSSCVAVFNVKYVRHMFLAICTLKRNFFSFTCMYFVLSVALYVAASCFAVFEYEVCKTYHILVCDMYSKCDSISSM